eukprot:scaffold105658_cov65-Attheya_sp.AAC.3
MGEVIRDVGAEVAEIRGGSAGHDMLRWKVLEMTRLLVETRTSRKVWLTIITMMAPSSSMDNFKCSGE